MRWRTTADQCAEQQWPELLSALFQASQSPDAGQREGAFRIFTTTPAIIEKQHEDAVQGAFAKAFKDTEVGVRDLVITSHNDSQVAHQMIGTDSSPRGLCSIFPRNREEVTKEILSRRR